MDITKYLNINCGSKLDVRYPWGVTQLFGWGVDDKLSDWLFGLKHDHLNISNYAHENSK